MTARSPDLLARRYVAWVRQRALTIIIASGCLLAGAVYLIIYRLPLYADFSYLLPQDTSAVRDLRKLESRVKSSDTTLVVIRSDNPQTTAAATKQMLDGLAAAKSPLISRITGDEHEAREFLRAHRHLLVPREELEHARDALKQRVAKQNPLYVDLEDEGSPRNGDEQLKRDLDDLRAKRRDAEAKLSRPTNVSADGRIAKLEIATTFRATDAKATEHLLETMAAVRAKVVAGLPGGRSESGPLHHGAGVDIGFTGGSVSALSEHRAITKGILFSSIITALLVALVLALYFRSFTLLVMLVGTIAIATAAAFGAASFTVGHLNAATAFLGAIIAGNGINYGILLIARYLEERRRREIDDALAAAIVGTLRPTAVASLGASIAYGSLAATSFKGFADFAVIGAIGMMLCWMASYTLLPALMLRFGRDTHIFHGDPFLGTWLVRLVGFKRSKLVCLLAGVVFLAAATVVVRYVAADPFEYNIKNLRSRGDDAITARNWMALSDKTFGRGFAGRTYIAADRTDQVPKIITALEKLPTIGSMEWLQKYVPDDQAEKLAVLGELRSLVDKALEKLDDDEAKELVELRPPDDLRPFTAADLPASLRDKFTEKDGRIGLVVSIRPANDLDEWNGKDLMRFASAVRELHLSGGETVTTSGASVIFADIIAAIEHDGPVVTIVALVGLIVMVTLLVGRNRRAAAVMVGTVGGSLLMIALCSMLGIKVNFLDFVALPITLGLGIDYAINVAHRHDHEDIPDPITTLRTSGSAVFVCSLTTMIGYGSLLVSENLAIRGFGEASLIGEVTCVMTALVVVPALLALGNRRQRRISPATPATA